jgi:hypothetical protein
MRIESALAVRRVKVRSPFPKYMHTASLTPDVRLDAGRVQRAHLARIRAPYLRADPDPDGQGGHVDQGGEAVAQGRLHSLSFLFTAADGVGVQDHNQRCLQLLSPHLKEDKRAMKWLKREADRGIGIATGPGGMSIDWD